MGKQFWSDSLKQFGVGIVFAAMLVTYYTNESKKWERNQEEANKRWEQLFQKYSDDQRQSLETIQACCREQNQRRRDEQD